MDKGLTPRQAVILLGCAMLATKFQRLPAIISERYGRDSWLVLLIWLVIDSIILMLSLWAFYKLKNKSFFELVEEKCGKFVKILLCIVLWFFFFIKSNLTYKATHEFFANTLFDKLSWELFSPLLLVVLFIMVKNGINVIARSSEFYSALILVGVVSVVLLGVTNSDFARLTPILDQNFWQGVKDSYHFDAFFSDYVFVIMLIGSIKLKKENEYKKLYRSIVLTFFGVGLFIVFFFMVFYAVNEYLAEAQVLALSAITQYSFSGLSIGRPDWILVMLAFLSTIITTAFFVWCTTLCVKEIFGIKKSFWIALINLIILYVSDVFVFSNIETTSNFILQNASVVMIIISLFVPAFLLAMAIFTKKKKGRRRYA